jgi:Plasmid encoded RepA protein
MGTIHELIGENGKQGALQFGEFGRSEIEAAAAYMADEENAIGYLYSGWCQAALPHRKLPDDKGWQVRSGSVGLIVQPGMRFGAANEPVPVGVPYGSRARLILIYLQGEAIRTQSREVELGRSLRVWMGKLGISIGGDSVAAVRNQADRIARCSMTFEIEKGQKFGLFKQNIVDAAMFEEDARGGPHFVNTALLSEAFFVQLKKHPVPLEEAAIRALSNNSMGLDVYAWLAYRLHSLKGPTEVPWRALMGQFGAGFGRINNFKPRFLENLRLALAVYPDAKVDVEEGRGLTLYPSRPPVLKTLPPRRVLLNPTPDE